MYKVGNLKVLFIVKYFGIVHLITIRRLQNIGPPKLVFRTTIYGNVE